MTSAPENRKKTGRAVTQFKPGQSGNPGGRPRDLLTQAVRSKVTQDEADKLAAVLIKLAKAGDVKALGMIWDRLEGKAVSREEKGPPGAFDRLDDIPEDAARSVIAAAARFKRTPPKRSS